MRPAPVVIVLLVVLAALAIWVFRPEASHAERGDVPADVVAFGSGAPVAGAVVRYRPADFDLSALPPRLVRELALLARDPEALLERIGRAATADAAGRCQVPAATSHPAIVMARCGVAGRQAEAHGTGSAPERTDSSSRAPAWTSRSWRSTTCA